MTELKRPHGRYRETNPASGATYANVSDGSMAFDIDEATYRLREYLPAYDALPTKAEYLENGGQIGG
ncbi:hypothetical protein ACO2Q3_13735 [Caulobacter sp. KR2-114]|uniref:hypothetical protein n=1 Tax=Caulobacter sp. KR2-114 TaxID=3400912 RepID=UPI003BFC41C3